jgi:protein-L-isoaspartate(D-aspartate) O-methyltransferase
MNAREVYALRSLLTSAVIFCLAAACAPVTQPLTPSPQSLTPGAQPLTPAASAAPAEDPAFALARERMVAGQIEARGVSDPATLAAMRAVPRHAFVPVDYLEQAYADHPLPIGFGQTISQPYIVALMTELLGLEGGERVLEIGTGSGYQAAVLAEILDEVYTVEIVPELAEAARQRLDANGYSNAISRQGDGYFGWEAHAPYDAIIVTAAPDHLPQPLVAQLKEGARLVIPIGPVGGYQVLWKFVKEGADVKAYRVLDVSFVPLVGGTEGTAAP